MPRTENKKVFYSLQLLNDERRQFPQAYLQPLVGTGLEVETASRSIETEHENRIKKRCFHLRRATEKSDNSTQRLKMILARFDPKLRGDSIAENIMLIGREFETKVC